MGSIDSSPQSWVPTYMNVRDCSLGYCSRFCPEWCYVFVPPPPSFEIAEDNSSSSPTFSPLVIAIIGILVSAFLLVSYYTIMSKYCGNEDRRSRSIEDYGPTEELEGTLNPSIHEPWYVVTVGLDEALINSLTVWKYKKEDKLVEGTDCAVCLSEFEEDESLRLLPKCNHAFHLPCIDTWLKSHSNCPLCRANITSIDAPRPQLPRVVTEAPPSINNAGVNVVMATQDSEMRHRQSVEMMHADVDPKTPLRAFSDLGNSEERDAIIEIGGDDAFHQNVRRSVSMDYYSQHRVSVADILRMNEEEDEEHVHGEGCSETDEIAGSSKQSATGRVGMSSHRKGDLRNVPAMNRSFSSGRLFQSRPAKARHTVIPL